MRQKVVQRVWYNKYPMVFPLVLELVLWLKLLFFREEWLKLLFGYILLNLSTPHFIRKSRYLNFEYNSNKSYILHAMDWQIFMRLWSKDDL